MDLLKNCHDCGAKPGQQHRDGCDVERCSICGRQRISCFCGKKEDKDFAKWTRIWPGEAESKFLGLDLNQFYDHNLHQIFFVKKGLLADETQA